MHSIEINSLSCRIHDKSILSDVSFQLPKSSCCGLLGPNGAGKTTLFRILSGLLEYQEGRVMVCGHELPGDFDSLKPKLGLYLGDLGFYNHLSIKENLLLSGYLYGLADEENKERTGFLLELMGLSSLGDVQVSKASKGMKKKTALALSLIHDPHIVLWDEPFEGIDYPSLIHIFKVVKDLTQKGRSFLIVSHIFEYLEAVISHYAVMDQGCFQSQGAYDTKSQRLKTIFSDLAPIEKQVADLPWL